MKIRPVGAELFHADGWKGGETDKQHMMKLRADFLNFANAPKNYVTLVFVLTFY
jgi:hypothetical protein